MRPPAHSVASAKPPIPLNKSSTENAAEQGDGAATPIGAFCSAFAGDIVNAAWLILIVRPLRTTTIMSATDTAKEVIRIATTAGLSKDVIDLQAAKLDILVKENAELSTKVSRLEIENRQLRSQLEDFQPVAKPADTCLYCRRATGEVVELSQHPVFFMQGWKVAHYKCSNPQCGKTYERDLES